MYYNEELGREQSATEVACGLALAVATVVGVWFFLSAVTE